MDEFEKIIEKYRRELMDFSKACGNNICEKAAASAPSTEGNEADSGKMIFNPKDEELPDLTPDPISQPTENSITPVFEDFDDFIKNNPQSGTLRVQVFAGGRVFPVSSAKITVVLELKNESREMFEGLSDINGIIDGIQLPAPEKEMSQSPSQSASLPYSSYTVYVEHPDFVSAVFREVPVFSGTKSIQGAELIPLAGAGGEPSAAADDESNSFSRLKGDD